MRSFTDKDGKTAWIFDEETHPMGIKKTIVVEPVKETLVQEIEEEVKTFFKKKKKK